MAINIVNFEAVHVDDFHTVFHLWEDTHRHCLLTDALEIHYIDVRKFNALPGNSLHYNIEDTLIVGSDGLSYDSVNARNSA